MTGKDVYEKEGMLFRKTPKRDFLINPTETQLKELEGKVADLFIELNSAFKGFSPNISFINSFNFISGISSVGEVELNLKVIYGLPNLVMLSIPIQYKQTIDFSELPNLRECRFHWSPRILKLDTLKLLEKVSVSAFLLPDFSAFASLHKLKEIQIAKSKAESLDGLQGAELLEILDFWQFPKLANTAALGNLVHLKKIVLERVTISSLENFRNLSALEVFYAYNCKSIASLDPIRNLSKLQFICLNGDTFISDGDMTPLIGRKHATFVTRKHYSHTSAQIDSLNGTVMPKQTWDY